MSIYNEQFDKLHTGVTAESVIAAANNAAPKKRIKKAVAVPVSIAAAMCVLVVSVGAACNWDFRSLVLSDYARNRQETAKMAGMDIGSDDELFMYGDSVTVPNGMREHHEMTGKELELLDRLTVDVGETLESDDFDFCLNGLIYDGYILRVSATITDKNNSEIDWRNDDMVFTILIDDMDGDINVVGMGAGHGGDYTGKNHIDWTYQWRVHPFPENVDSVTFIVRKRGETVNGYTDYYDCGRITAKLPDTGGLSRAYKLDETTGLGNYGASRLNMVRFSPLGVYVNFDFNLSGDIKDINSVHIGRPPVYITMNDGTVIGFQNVFGAADGRGHGRVYEDGSFNYGWQISQENYIIDAFDVAAVQIGDCTIWLDDSMIIEE